MLQPRYRVNESPISICWQLLISYAAVVIACIAPDTAVAGARGSNAIEQVMCNVLLIFTGTTGMALAAVTLICVGAGALLGKVSWSFALVVALGVALIFGTANIVTPLGGNATTCTAGTVISP